MLDRSPDFKKLEKICFVIKENHAVTDIKGTGFFIDASGIALTAWHVIKELNTKSIAIRFERKSAQNKKSQTINTLASVIQHSEEHDLAVLSVKEINLASDDILPLSIDYRFGDEVLVAGYQEQDHILGLNPLKMYIDPDKANRSVRLKGEIEHEKRIVLVPQDDKDVIHKGTSGGPVLNKVTGSIIGVVLGTMADEGLQFTKEVGYAAPFLDLPRELDELTRRLSKHEPVVSVPLWNVPYECNPYFTGRENKIKDLVDALSRDSEGALTQAISGLGGIGKTQIAVEYAYRYRDKYSAVFWVRADTTLNLSSGFLEMARMLNLPEKDARDSEKTISAVKRWL